MFKAACCTAAAVLLFLPLAFWLYSVTPVNPAEQAAVADHFMLPKFCRPEPGERVVYLCGIVFVPLVLFGLLFVWRRWVDRLPPLPASLVVAFEVAFAFGVTATTWLALVENDYYHLRHNLFFRHPWWAFLLLPAALAAMWWNWGQKQFVRPFLHLFTLGLVGVVLLASVFTDKGCYSTAGHFNAALYPVVQVYFGKALLVNCASQYGLYPHLLQPLFAVCGLSVLRFTLVMGLLTAGSYAALYWFLWRSCDNKTAAFVGFAALIGNCWFAFELASGLDLYFQYYPIRFVFPALLVALVLRQLQKPTKGLYWALFVLAAVGVLWNLDSGLPTLLSWTATLCFAELFGADCRRAAVRIIRHLAAAGSVLALTVGLYMAAVRLGYGAYPNVGRLFYYQRLYFVAGFYKLPMGPPSTWLLVGLIYAAGLAFAFSAVVARQETVRPKIVFFLSVLGVGLSSYFQGRSHPNILLLVWWPCQLLLVLFLDDLLQKLKERPARALPWFAAAVLSWYLVGAAFTLETQLRFVSDRVIVNYGLMHNPAIPHQGRAEAAFLDRVLPPGQEVVVAADNAADVQLAAKRAGVNPIYFPTQMVLKEEFNQLGELLAGAPTAGVLIDKTVYLQGGWSAANRGVRRFVVMLQRNYELAAAAENCCFFTRNLESQLFPDGNEEAMLHLGFQEGAPLNAVPIGPISTSPPWSLEMAVKPSAEQGPHATLIGNHPGRGAGGFVVHQESPGLFTLVLGDGKAWHRPVQFHLRPDEWNYLALVRTQDAVAAYVNGDLIASSGASDIQNEDSFVPLRIGNWDGNDRPFNGAVKEARMLNRARMAKTFSWGEAR